MVCGRKRDCSRITPEKERTIHDNLMMCVFVCTIYLHYFKTDTVGRLADALLFSERGQWVVSLHQGLEKCEWKPNKKAESPYLVFSL